MLIKLNEKILTALPIFIAMNIAAVLVWLLNIVVESTPLFLGIIAAGLVDQDNRLSGRLKHIFYTLIAFSISSITTQYFLERGALFILSMTGMTFLFTMIGAIGQRYSTIAFGALTVSLYTTLTYFPSMPWFFNPLMILSGTLLYSFVTIIVHLFFPNRPVQERVSRSFMLLADYLDAKAAFFDPDDVEQIEQKQLNLALKSGQLISAFNDCRTALFYRMRGNNRHSYTTQMSRYFFAAQDIHERANSSHFDYQLLNSHLKNTDLIFRVLRLLELQAQACRDIAQCLQQKRDFQTNSRLERAISGITQSFELFCQHNHNARVRSNVKTLIDNLKNTHWQLQSLSQQSTLPQQVDQLENNLEDTKGIKRIIEAITSNFTLQSQLFRHAVRLSIMVFICCCMVEIFQLQSERGYWILLTVIFVCQPNYSATKQRLKQRMIGTVLGVLVGSCLPYIAPTVEMKLGVVVITSTLFYFFRVNNYSFSTFFITIQVLATFDIMGFNIYDATLPRLMDTIIGIILAWFAVSFLWPDWKYLQLSKVIRRAIAHDARYLLHIIAYIEFGKGDNFKYRIARNNAQDSATALCSTMTNMNNEPVKYAPYLQQGFELLRLNTALLGYISALGAYRHHIQDAIKEHHSLAEFYPIAKKMVYLLEHIHQLSETEFNHIFQQIKQRLQQNDDKNESNATFYMPMQQLFLISQLLPALYVASQQKMEHKNEITSA
ncbi:YccS family putative transporter [Pasteurellaceae bacterium 22721_9_1]